MSNQRLTLEVVQSMGAGHDIEDWKESVSVLGSELS